MRTVFLIMILSASGLGVQGCASVTQAILNDSNQGE